MRKGPRKNSRQSTAPQAGAPRGIFQTCASLSASGLSLVKRTRPEENTTAARLLDPDRHQTPASDTDPALSRRTPDRVDVVVPRPGTKDSFAPLAGPGRAPILPISRTEIALLRAHLGPAIDAILFDGDT
jgi:hypothetical protein